MSQHVPTAIGSSHPDLDVKFGEAGSPCSTSDGRIDCILIGSSVVLRGIDPVLVAAAYHAQTGEDITCFNFGIAGIQALSLADVVEIIVRRYHPRLLVYGIILRDLGFRDNAQAESRAIANTAWIQYQLGDFSVEGWAVDHLVTLRHFLALRQWPRPSFQNPIRDLSDPPRTGFVPFTSYADTYSAEKYLKNYTIWPEQWTGFERLIALGERTHLLIIEVPLPDQTLAAFEGGPEAYQRTMDNVARYAAEHGIDTWMTTRLHLIPADGWVGDTHHLHRIGAQVFSQWLGDQLGQAVKQGRLTF